MSDTSSFDSLNSDNEFYNCINTLEKEVSQKYNFFMEKKYIENLEIEKKGNSPIDTQQPKGENLSIEKMDNKEVKNSPDRKIKDIDSENLFSKIESLKDVKVGEINHKGTVIDVYIDRNKKKYVNYKGKRVYT